MKRQNTETNSRCRHRDSELHGNCVQMQDINSDCAIGSMATGVSNIGVGRRKKLE